jgi:hypothetical protein
MRIALQCISWIALAAMFLPPIGFLLGQADLEATQHTMWLATIAWFVTAPLWMNRGDGATA